MLDFTFHNPTRIIFGRNAQSQVGKETRAMGKKALLHYGGGSAVRSGLLDQVKASLTEAGVDFVELGGVQPNPIFSLVEKGITLCQQEGVDCILAVGGGSVIDSAKAIGMGVAMNEDIWPCFLGQKEVTATIPVGSVLTIPAAGSESSISCVITHEDGWFKRGLSSTVILPVFACINPELTFTLPPYQIGCGCTDILAHMMERYFTNTKNVDVSDRMLEGIMRSVLLNAPITYQNPKDYDSRAEICWAGTLAHNTLLDRGRIGDWASHGIEMEISGIYDIAHGAGLAIIFPAWMRYVYRHNVPRFLQFATRVMDVDMAMDDPDAIILESIRRLEDFYRSIGMPVRLSEVEIGDDRLREMAEKTVVHLGGTRGNLIPLTADDIEAIYRLAL